MAAPKIDLDPSTVAIVAVVAVGGFLLMRAGKAAADVVPKAVGGAVDMAGGLLSGNNRITESARTNAYEGWGVLGTLGAAVDNISGGLFSKLGEWQGQKIYDLTHWN